jgi:hypothetical protein
MDKGMMHAKWHCTPSVNNRDMAICFLKNAFCVSGAIFLKCFGRFYWNMKWVYIWIRGWCTPNDIVHHLLITELWPFVSWNHVVLSVKYNTFVSRSILAWAAIQRNACFNYFPIQIFPFNYFSLHFSILVNSIKQNTFIPWN